MESLLPPEVFYRVTLSSDPVRAAVEFVSPECLQLTGCSPQDFVENPNLWIDSVHPDDRPLMFGATQAILLSKVPATRYYRIKNHKSGEWRHIADRVVPLVDAKGAIVGYEGTARDTTERVRAEQQPNQA